MQVPRYLEADHLISLATAATAAVSTVIVDNLKYVNDVVGSAPVDKWMDSISGVGHRIKHGHSLGDLSEVFDQFGLDGVLDYFNHLGKDLCSPHGIPLPFLNEIRQVFDVKVLDSIEWGCINAGDILPSGLSLVGMFKTFNRIKATEKVSRQDIAIQTITITANLALGIGTTNPFMISKVIFDVSMLAWSAGKTEEWQAFLESQFFKSTSTSIFEFCTSLIEYLRTYWTSCTGVTLLTH